MSESVERRLAERGLTLPAETSLPSSVTIPFRWARIVGTRVHLSGHGPLAPDGTPAGPFGRVPGQVSPEQAQQSARLALLAVLGSLKRAIGDLDRVAAWSTVTGFINAEPGFAQNTMVINPVSSLLLELFGPEVGAHARVAPGVNGLPFDVPVVVAAEVELSDLSV